MNTPSSRHIVVIENDRLTLDFMRDMMALWGYTPHAYRNPADALEQIRSGAIVPDLLLVDLHLEEYGSGDAVIRQVRQVDGLAQIPAFVATGDLGYRARDLENVQVLTKPIRPERFKESLKELFAGS